MKGKINLKTILVFGILILVIILSVIGVRTFKNMTSNASADYEPQGLVSTPATDGKSAVVSWETDKSVKASVFYGTNMASLLLMAADSEETVSHRISLGSLKPNTTYYYKVVVDENNTFDNEGSMFSFKTTAAVTPTPTIELKPEVALTPSSTSSATGSTTCDRTTDYDKNGVINSIDFITCSKGTTTATSTPTITTNCAGDYNKDGVINSLDRIKCLQDGNK
jgi:phosphodiesterase/alkaline phosphatase D-like protein